MQHLLKIVVLKIEFLKITKVKTNKILLLAGLLTAILIWSSGCSKYPWIDGNNQVTSETRTLVSFNEIENEGDFEVHIRNDTVFTATIEAEANLIPHIRTRINGNTLEIDTRENLRNNYPMKVYVTAPIINGALLNGSGNIKLDSIKTESIEVKISGSGDISGEINASYLLARINGSGTIDLDAHTNSCDVRISGSGDMELTGESLSGDFSISGSGSIRAYNFAQNEVIAKISGSGDMYLNVADKLDVTISGSGSVNYIGDPDITVKITGSGNVNKQ